MPVIGNSSVFSIEYDLQKPDPAFGRVRLWLHAEPLGDYEEEMFLYDMCIVFRTLINRRISKADIVFDRTEQAPSLQELAERGGWSFGESFDAYLLVYYAVLADDSINWHWKHTGYGVPTSGDDYMHARHQAIDGAVFDAVAVEYLTRLGLSF